jgi:hypothetical protein
MTWRAGDRLAPARPPDPPLDSASPRAIYSTMTYPSSPAKAGAQCSGRTGFRSSPENRNL